MAAPGLTTPHTLPNGQVIQVPSYLAPPSAWGPGDPMAQAAKFQPDPVANMRAQLAPAAPAAAPASHAAPPDKFGQLAQLGGQPTAIDPSQRVVPGQRQPGAAPARPGEQPSGISDSVREVMSEAGRGGGARRPGGLQVASKKLEITPGRDLIPEQKWALGLEERPQEAVPEAEAPAWTDDPATWVDDPTRPVETPITRGAATTGNAAAGMLEGQLNAQREHNNAQKEALVAHSQLLDDQLTQISTKRQRVAELQSIADQRMAEARSSEPRTRGEIWESKGNLARGMAILAAVLGGAAAGLRGGPNMAWQMIDKNIDDTVQEERYRSEKRMQLGLAAKSDFERAYQMYGDLDIATLDNRQRKLQSMIGIIDAQAANRGLDANQQQLLAATRQEAEQKFLTGAQQLYDRLNGHVEKESVELKNVPASGGGGGASTKLKMLEAGAKATKYEDEILRRKKGAGRGSPAERAKLNSAEANMAPLKTLLSRYKDSDEIPGLQPRGAASRGVRAALDWGGGTGTGTKTLDTTEERVNRLIADRAANAYRVEVTGAGASEAEVARLSEQFAGARTKAELQAAMRLGDEVIAEHRRLLDQGGSDVEATQLDPSAQPVE